MDPERGVGFLHRLDDVSVPVRKLTRRHSLLLGLPYPKLSRQKRKVFNHETCASLR